MFINRCLICAASSERSDEFKSSSLDFLPAFLVAFCDPFFGLVFDFFFGSSSVDETDCGPKSSLSESPVVLRWIGGASEFDPKRSSVSSSTPSFKIFAICLDNFFCSGDCKYCFVGLGCGRNERFDDVCCCTFFGCCCCSCWRDWRCEIVDFVG